MGIRWWRDSLLYANVIGGKLVESNRPFGQREIASLLLKRSTSSGVTPKRVTVLLRDRVRYRPDIDQIVSFD